MNNWKVHFRTEAGGPLCGQRQQVNISLTGNREAVSCKRCADRLGPSSFAQIMNRMSEPDKAVLRSRGMRQMGVTVSIRSTLLHGERDAQVMADLMPIDPSWTGSRSGYNDDRAWCGFSDAEIDEIKASDEDKQERLWDLQNEKHYG